MNHLARALALALLLLLSLLPAFGPAQFIDCTSAEPPDGSVFAVGEPITFTHATEFDSVPMESVSRGVLNLDVDFVQYGMSDYGDTTLKLRVPGQYRIRRGGLIQNSASLRLCDNFIEIPDACPRGQFPPPEPEAPFPVIHAERIDPLISSVVTMDGDLEVFQQYEIRNDGDSDLVILGIYQAFDEGLIELYAKNIEPYTRIAPGKSRIFTLGIKFVTPQPFPNGSQVTYSIVVESNDPNRPFVGLLVPGIFFFTDRASVSVVIPELPPIPPAPICGDFNDDGVLDAADIESRLLGENP